MKVSELISHLSRVNPEAEVFMWPTDREGDLLPIIKIEFKLPPTSTPTHEDDPSWAVEVAFRTHPRDPGNAVLQIEKMQKDLMELMGKLEGIQKGRAES